MSQRWCPNLRRSSDPWSSAVRSINSVLDRVKSPFLSVLSLVVFESQVTVLHGSAVLHTIVILLAHVHEEERDGGERCGVDWERPQKSRGQASSEGPPSFSPHALTHAVHDAVVPVGSAHSIRLEAGLNNIHRIGGDPRRHSRHATRQEQLGNDVSVVGVAAQRSRQRVVREEVDSEPWRLADDGGHHPSVYSSDAFLAVDADQAVQRVPVELPGGALLARSLHLHAGLGQLHRAADHALDESGRRAREELVPRRVRAQHAHGVPLHAEDDGVDEGQAHHGRADALIEAGHLEPNEKQRHCVICAANGVTAPLRLIGWGGAVNQQLVDQWWCLNTPWFTWN